MMTARHSCLVGLALALVSAALAAEAQGANPCEIRRWQTTDNGIGAEPGAVREFATGITMPPGCLRGGKVWVPRLLLGVTRTGGGAPDMDVRVSIRPTDTPVDAPLAQLPAGPRTPPAPYTLDNVPVFPASGTYEVDTGAFSNQNINNVLWGDYFYVSVDMNGDNSAGQFLAADEQGAVITDCYTATGGATPTDPCTNGNPNLSGVGQGAIGYTFYGRYVGGEAVDGREPLGTTWAARYVSPSNKSGPNTEGDPIDLRVREGADGAVICTHLDIPDDFEFTCNMTAPQLALLADGEIFVELTGGGPTRSTRMLPADLFIFADGFESGDTSVWSTSVE